MHNVMQHYEKTTVAEKDTVAAAQAAVGYPKATVGHQRATHRLRLGLNWIGLKLATGLKCRKLLSTWQFFRRYRGKLDTFQHSLVY